MNKKDLEYFHGLLTELERRLSQSVEGLENEALKTAGGLADDLSHIPAEHLADLGSDNFVRDLKIGVLQNTDAELCDVRSALEKIEAGTYGPCENCSEKIAMKRLKALPFARLCLKCRQEEERYAEQQEA